MWACSAPSSLALMGAIHAAGSWILHPRGRHNIAQGALPSLVTRCIETDDVMGCFYCHRKAVWEQVGGYDENLLRGQTEDFSLMARMKGWRVIAVPNIEYVHAHAARKPRDNRADTTEGLDATRDAFHRKWGFDRLAADLDFVAKKYSGTPLLWNARVFGPRDQWPAISEKPIEPQSSEWGRFINDASFRDAMRARAPYCSEHSSAGFAMSSRAACAMPRWIALPSVVASWYDMHRRRSGPAPHQVGAGRNALTAIHGPGPPRTWFSPMHSTFRLGMNPSMQ